MFVCWKLRYVEPFHGVSLGKNKRIELLFVISSGENRTIVVAPFY